MLTRIQHAAIVSENFVREAQFFEAVFGMKRSKPGSAEEAESDPHELRGEHQRRLCRCDDDRPQARLYPRAASLRRRCRRCRRSDHADQEKLSRSRRAQAAVEPALRHLRRARSGRQLFRSDPRRDVVTGAMFMWYRNRPYRRATEPRRVHHHQAAGDERVGDRGFLPRSVRLEKRKRLSKIPTSISPTAG